MGAKYYDRHYPEVVRQMQAAVYAAVYTWIQKRKPSKLWWYDPCLYLSNCFPAQVVKIRVVQLFANTMSL